MEWAFRADAPIYAQLCEQLTLAIVSGAYGPGERLPSVRELALDAGVNPNTVQRALSELERDGLVYSQRTAGRFVTENAYRLALRRDTLARERARRFLDTMETLGYDRLQTLDLLENMKGDES